MHRVREWDDEFIHEMPLIKFFSLTSQSFTVWHSLVFSEPPCFQLSKQLSTKSPKKRIIVKMAVKQ